jgi:hypothetical protein
MNKIIILILTMSITATSAEIIKHRTDGTKETIKIEESKKNDTDKETMANNKILRIVKIFPAIKYGKKIYIKQTGNKECQIEETLLRRLFPGTPIFKGHAIIYAEIPRFTLFFVKNKFSEINWYRSIQYNTEEETIINDIPMLKINFLDGEVMGKECQ